MHVGDLFGELLHFGLVTRATLYLFLSDGTATFGFVLKHLSGFGVIVLMLTDNIKPFFVQVFCFIYSGNNGQEFLFGEI